jgi:hypothetical protein
VEKEEGCRCMAVTGNSRTPGYKWSLLKVRKGKYKGKHGADKVEARSQENVFLLFK